MQDDDSISNPSTNLHFDAILERSISRRGILAGSIGMAAAAFFGLPRAGELTGSVSTAEASRFTSWFTPVPTSSADTITVPIGYRAEVLYAWGDPISDGPQFLQNGGNSAADQMVQAGMHHDGMHYFPLPGFTSGNSQHGLLVMNHEYTDDELLHTGGTTPWTPEKVTKSKAAHGVSVIEIALVGNRWQVVRPSSYARRVTADTPMRLSGPVAESAFVKTAFDPSGTTVLGTFNNCAHGYTPWGTYLAAEENWNGYFSVETGSISTEQARYGVNKGGAGYRWHEHDERFRADLHPNELNRFGWVVEIDPYDPKSVPAKRTALGRIKHEGAWSTLASDGRVVIYSGDDERNEYIYKFVSRDKFNPSSRGANRDLLDSGTLYVAKFHDNGSGEWLPLVFGESGLTPANGFSSQAEVLVKTRQAADRAGATMMDRPEWIAVHPSTGEVYCTLTNNSRRGTSTPSVNAANGTTAANSARPPVDAANPRPVNPFGHIIRWRENLGDAASTTFEWDIFVLAGDPAMANLRNDPNLKGNINGDIFGSPDGLWFDHNGMLWIQTDISSSAVGLGEYANIGNNQMLAADVTTGEIRRFLTGPLYAEVTGVVTTPDGTSMFVNIQHPGENPGGSGNNDPANPTAFSTWPDGAAAGRPRSATIVIRKDDGGVIGS